MVIGQGYGLGTGGCKRLGYTFSLSVSVKDRLLHKDLGKS